MRKLIFGNENAIKRNCYIWNIVAGLVNASEAIVFSMIVTRVTGLGDAGILSIAFALGNLFMTIGKFGTRNFQVTDLEEKYSFSDYLYLRIVTVFGMLVCSMGYVGIKCAGGSYSFDKAVVILCICLIYVIESVEDVYAGLYQQKGRLDVGSRVFCVRWAVIMVSFSVCILLFKDLQVAMLLSLVLSLVTEIALIACSFDYFKTCISGFRKEKVWDVGKQSFDLFIVSFLLYYITNSPKYSIDTYMSDEIQACFGFVFMPVFAIELLNNFLYQPILVDMAREWQNRQTEKFMKRINKQLFILLILTVLCLAAAWLLGVPVLELVYATELEAYKTELLILLGGGGMLAVVGFLSVVMTVMRCQRKLLYGYVGVAVLAMVVVPPIVKHGGILGASVVFFFIMFVLAAVFWGLVMWNVRKGNRENVDGE